MTITLTGASYPDAATWQPKVGAKTEAFVAKKTSGANALTGLSMNVVLNEACDILAHCISPEQAEGSTAVLAVGYVQSGKTLSFTTVTALARDNGYGLVIILAGTTNNLKDQSEARLEKDLGLEDLQRDWRHFDNPDHAGSTFDDMKKTLLNWDRRRQGVVAEEKPALLVTVLKHAQRLNSAAALLADLKLDGVPALIVDDESDQAGLNTMARKNLLNGTSDESGTYEAILALRNSLPHHSYLQYTATPQANLLLRTTDTLNPSFAKVISSGAGYTGGKEFFQSPDRGLIVKVPDSELFDAKNPFPEPPKMLQEALRVFLLGLANGAGSDGHSNRSMMVQAHQNTVPHKLYSTWISRMLEAWSRGLTSDIEAARVEIADSFIAAHAELSRTVLELPSLETLLAIVPERIADIRVVIVNSTNDAEKKIKWNKWHFWILIGGQKLDRGFTVEGLTVTYMPRRVSGNADVLQQRARFFGYRESYIAYCRVYLIADAIDAFRGYVDDEEFLRDGLRSHEGKPLSEWKRDFILHRQLSRPTRPNVVGRRAKRLPLNDGWTWPKSMHLDHSVEINNSACFQDLLESAKPHLVDSVELPGVVDRRVRARRNLAWIDAPLIEVADRIIKLRFAAAEDSLLSNALGMALGRMLASNSSAKCCIVFMSELETPDGPGRQLSVLRNNIHVGMSPDGATGPDINYSGDRSVVSSETLTFQLRLVKLSSPSPDVPGQYDAVPWLAIHFPSAVPNDAWLEVD